MIILLLLSAFVGFQIYIWSNKGCWHCSLEGISSLIQLVYIYYIMSVLHVNHIRWSNHLFLSGWLRQGCLDLLVNIQWNTSNWLVQFIYKFLISSSWMIERLRCYLVKRREVNNLRRWYGLLVDRWVFTTLTEVLLLWLNGWRITNYKLWRAWLSFLYSLWLLNEPNYWTTNLNLLSNLVWMIFYNYRRWRKNGHLKWGFLIGRVLKRIEMLSWRWVRGYNAFNLITL